ncbi:class I SAM-dependent methyltransferase [Plantactinospora sp. S1510]|uniref:Class I SAM-dependent methyltransferase n=1 Tax=Plantactinospora alkalitolerans TaxID=2789879 RepID=A0ABS0GQB8_9ACTN|nr:class I SAM-dependent methyltransferase [Plantactinospora alkalitolerans]MBF9128296.1 class I SAM-dependent methyltransferase [Plantactinospora alkalitolerans]
MAVEGFQTGVIRRARGISAALSVPPYVKPGHYYSPATAPADRATAIRWRDLAPVGVDLREAEQLRLADELAPLLLDLPTDRWQDRNGMYGRADAAVLHAMLRHHRPARLIEVGSGYSTAVALDVAERFLPELRITCVEPHPARLQSRLRPGDEVELIQRPVQDVDRATFATLRSGDILLIDSTHVVKAGSDVVWLFLHVLPTLRPGVIVHIHDIHWPFEYPERWLREGRDWTEVYLLRAFLTDNTAWRVLLFTSWLWACRPQAVPAELRGLPTGAFWMRRTE